MVPFDLVLDQPREVGRVLKGLPKDHDCGGEVSRRATRWAMCLYSCGITMGRRGFGWRRSQEGIHSLEFGDWGQGLRQWQLAERGLAGGLMVFRDCLPAIPIMTPEDENI